MSKLQIEIAKIKCVRTSGELSPDEIYAGLFLYKGSEAGSTVLPLHVAVSDIRTNVRKGEAWRPNDAIFTFDLGNTELFALQFMLFERDDAAKYKAIVALSDKMRKGDKITPDDLKPIFNKSTELYDYLLNTALPTKQDIDVKSWQTADWTNAVNTLIKILGKAFRQFKQDDILGAEPFAYQLNNPNLPLPKSFTFKRLFAEYEVILNFSVIDDTKPHAPEALA